MPSKTKKTKSPLAKVKFQACLEGARMRKKIGDDAALIGRLRQSIGDYELKMNRLRELEQFHADISSLVGNAHIALSPAQACDFELGGLESFRMHPSLGPEITKILRQPEIMPPAQIMHLLTVKSIRDELAQEMHVVARIDGKLVGYCISESALRKTPRPMIVRKISNAIAERLIHEAGFVGGAS